MAKHNADLLVLHAAELLTCKGPAEGIRGDALRQIDAIEDGGLAIANGRIVGVGTSADIAARFSAKETLDATGRLVSPGFVDSHCHLVYGGTRHEEHEAKVTQRAPARQMEGGIRFTVRKTRDTSDEALVAQAKADLDVMLLHGTTTLEAKTGYGLEMDAELRLMKLTASIRHTVDIVPTFLPLHVMPEGYDGRRPEYIAKALAALDSVKGMAKYCDVSCDPGCFTYDECITVGKAAIERGMKIRLHADQHGDAKAGLCAEELQASSADHLDYCSDEGFRAMARSGTVCTFLPGVTLHLCEMTPRFTDGGLGTAEKPFMPMVVRRALDAGVVAALSTDYNPGSCPTPSMQIVMALAARLFRLGYAEIWHMCTLNAAKSLDLAHDRGSLEEGKRADVVLWDVPSHGMVINRFGINLANTVIAAGRVVTRDGRLAA